MISSKRDLQYYLECDKKALDALGKRPKIIGNEIWKFEILLRKVEYYKNCKKSLVEKVYSRYLRYRFHNLGVKLGYSIPPNVFGPGLCIAHIGTIVVHSNARVGNNCRIYVDVNIGANTGGPIDVPTLGDNVFIAPGAKLFGKITIADNISIGANSVVTKSFLTPGITIAGVPAKQISDKNANEDLMIKTAM